MMALFKILTIFILYSSVLFASDIDSLLIKNDTAITALNMNIGKTSGFSAGRYIFALIIIILLIAGLYIFLKYLKNKSNLGFNNKNIELLDRYDIDVNQKLYIARVGNNLFLIGGGSSLNLIYKFDEKESVQILSSYDEGLVGNHLGEFAGRLNDFMQKYKKKDV